MKDENGKGVQYTTHGICISSLIFSFITGKLHMPHLKTAAREVLQGQAYRGASASEELSAWGVGD